MRSWGLKLGRAAGLVATLAALTLGQMPGEIQVRSGPYTFSPVLIVANADTVPVNVVVRDQSGKVISGLKKENFRIFDDRRPQTITSFEIVTAPGPIAAPVAGNGKSAASPPPSAAPVGVQPRYVALLFDDVNSDRNDLAEARNAAVRFLDEQLGQGDRMAVFTVSSSQSLNFTADRAVLADTIAQISPHPRESATGFSTCPLMNPYEAYLIAVIHDGAAIAAKEAEASACSGAPPVDPKAAAAAAACGLKCSFGAPPVSGSGGVPVTTLAEANWEITRGISQDTLAAVRDVVDYAAKQPGQRIVVLASSGFFSETLEDQRDGIVRDALRAGVVINALDAKGLYTEGPEPALSEQSDEGVLPLAAYVFLEATKSPMREAQADAMANLAEATGGLYFRNNNDLTLGFERLGLAPETGFALAFTPTPLVRDGKLHNLQIELAPPIPGATVEARRGYFSPLPGPTPAEIDHDLYAAMQGTATASVVPVAIAVTEAAGKVSVKVHVDVVRPSEKVAMVAGLFNASGGFVTGERGEINLALKDSTFKKLRKTGLAPGFQLRAPAGHYRLRVVVEDETSGAQSEFSRPIEVQ